MTVRRRDFLKTGATAAVLAVVPGPLFALGRNPQQVPLVDDSQIKRLAMTAIDATRSAGAAYADVRLTHTWSREFIASRSLPMQREELGIGVRALVNGYWGFSSSTLWTPSEAARLGRAAVTQAKTNALGGTRAVELGSTPIVRDARWETPIEEDPFTVPFGEVKDLLSSWELFTSAKQAKGAASCAFRRQARAFASTDGSYLTQVVHRTSAGLKIQALDQKNIIWYGEFNLPAAGKGWEYVRTAQHRLVVERLLADIEERRALPIKPVEVGRYDIVFDANSVASLLDETLGAATELDRALGYEANAGGTSYLNDPLGMLGTERVGAPLLTVTGNRSMPSGVATVKWDDEGVEPDDFTLVKDGVLQDYQTTRESAAWLKGWYEKGGKPARSHGCSTGETAQDPPIQCSPNLTISPGSDDLSFDDLVAGTQNGLAITRASLTMDFQHMDGLGFSDPLQGAAVYEIKKGKKVALVKGAGFLVRAPELWKGLLALGGPKSREAWAATRPKGEPEQQMLHTVDAVPAAMKQVTVIEPARKA